MRGREFVEQISSGIGDAPGATKYFAKFLKYDAFLWSASLPWDGLL
jgi:hypothetical protein